MALIARCTLAEQHPGVVGWGCRAMLVLSTMKRQRAPELVCEIHLGLVASYGKNMLC